MIIRRLTPHSLLRIMPNMDEAKLIERCRDNDRDAQRELYQRFVERIHRLTLRLAGNPHDAFDLTQETFIRAFKALASFDERASLGTWLYRIATNEALQLFRRRRTEQRHLRVLAEQTPRETAPEQDGGRTDLDDALARLSDSHSAILILRYQEGLSYDEIASVLGCAPGTVASRLNRARAELRTILDGESPATAEEISALEHQKE